jgi:D-sedoheptulose 7-phosphate isomerase
MKSYQENYFQSIQETLADSLFSIENQNVDEENFFNQLLDTTREIKKNSGKIYFFGNGASASFANHMALDWSKNGKIISYSLSDSAFLTALSNDYNFDSIFKEFLVINEVGKNDLIVTISSSGNSSNVIGALNYCKATGIKALALSGLKPNNKSVELAHFSIYVPRKTYGIVECTHQIFLHLWLDNYMGIYEWERDTFQNMNIDDYQI